MSNKRSHPKPGHLALASKAVREEVLRVCSVLELIGTPVARKMREQLYVQLALTTTQVQKAAEVKTDLKNARVDAGHTDSGFIKGVSGTVGLIAIVDSKLHAKVPDISNLSAADPDGYAAGVVAALRGNGKLADGVAMFLDAAISGRLEARKRLVKVEEDQMQLNKGQASVSDLKSALQSALSLIHNTVEPGSPLLAMLKAPKKPKSKEKGGSKGKKQQPQQGDKQGSTAAPATKDGAGQGSSTQQPAPSGASAPNPSGNTSVVPPAAPSSEVKPPASAEAQIEVARATLPPGTSGMTNGVHA